MAATGSVPQDRAPDAVTRFRRRLRLYEAADTLRDIVSGDRAERRVHEAHRPKAARWAVRRLREANELEHLLDAMISSRGLIRPTAAFRAGCTGNSVLAVAWHYLGLIEPAERRAALAAEGVRLEDHDGRAWRQRRRVEAPAGAGGPVPDRLRPTDVQQELFDLFAGRAGRVLRGDAHRIWRPLVGAGAKPEHDRVTCDDFAVISLRLCLPDEVTYESLGLAPARRLASPTPADVVAVGLWTPAWSPAVPAEVACQMFALAEE